ncbi:MAG TPA: cytochrome b/b6 domain-containing protein [Burkholderiaceae bacterium]|nr:cytochrome b/b6 domain-containing protein [Burkholderiaceae bacterium]
MRVWDLPTRVFHWALMVLVVLSVVSAQIGGFWMDWHMRSGYSILTLVIFRLLWGFAGSRYARLGHFVRGPRVVLAYLRGRLSDAGAGHNPLGAVSVVAMLLLLLVQAATGLFTNDGSFTEGPLAPLVSSALGERLSTIHRWGESALWALVGLHVVAIVYYHVVRKQNLVAPMVTGDKVGLRAHPIEDTPRLWARAVILLAVSAALVAYVVAL